MNNPFTPFLMTGHGKYCTLTAGRGYQVGEGITDGDIYARSVPAHRQHLAGPPASLTALYGVVNKISIGDRSRARACDPRHQPNVSFSCRRPRRSHFGSPALPAPSPPTDDSKNKKDERRNPNLSH